MSVYIIFAEAERKAAQGMLVHCKIPLVNGAKYQKEEREESNGERSSSLEESKGEKLWRDLAAQVLNKKSARDDA